MAKRPNGNDAYMQQKTNVLKKLRDNNIRNEKELQNLPAEDMLKIPDITVQEMQVIIDLQKSVRAGRLYSYLIEAPEILIPKCVNRLIEESEEGGEEDAG